MHKKLKVMTVLGTRPDIIRLARIVALLEQYTEHILVHTGQNYDYELNQVFFEQLGMKKPDYFMNVDHTSVATVLGNVLIQAEKIMLKEQPDAVLILGDTNSSIAGIMARRLKIPLYHMEAGNRSYDANVPEELNRKIMDHISDVNMVYTEHARRNLLREGIHPKFLYLTGSPMKEVLDYYMKDIDESTILEELKLEEKKYFLASFHREQNVDNSDNLKKVLNLLNTIVEHYDMPIILSTHPRTRKRLEHVKGIELDKRISFLKPFGFFEYNKLQKHAYCVLSDSGSISEESSMLSFPAITVRNAVERIEAMDTGNIVLTGLDANTVYSCIDLVTKMPVVIDIPKEYMVINTAERALKIIMGTTKLIPTWTGMVQNDLTHKEKQSTTGQDQQ
tara:strand:- start:11940 stop:13115 length:1176 start_codon:yes stop_codon:yes gene_type:complete